MNKPLVKLLSLWVRDNDPFEKGIRVVDNHFISCGIWEVFGVEETEKGRIYTMKCIISEHSKLKIDTEIRMEESVIIILCHEVKITHQPKIQWKLL